jgi:glycogen debranching enzyme
MNADVRAGFSPENTPHLAPAFELDTAMLEFSASLASKGLPTTVSSEGDVDTLTNAFAEHLKTIKLFQYYVLDAAAEKTNIKMAITTEKILPWNGEHLEGKPVEAIAEIIRREGKVEHHGSLAKRYGVRVEGATAAGITKAAFPQLGDDAEALAEAWGRVVDVLNVPLYQEWEEDTRVALDQIKNRLKYTRLDPHGPKLGPISKE